MQLLSLETNSNNYILCVKCLNCKCKNGKIRCSEGYFDNKTERTVSMLTPQEFDCWQYDEVN